MKRMYVVLILMFGIVFWAGAILGQQGSTSGSSESDLMEKKLKLRQEMHRRMLDKLLHGIGPDQDMFSDMEKMMEEMMNESLPGFSSSFSLSGDSQFKMEWSETKNGRNLEITPKNPEQELDINVANGMITIQGKMKSQTQGAVSYSNFSNMISVPPDCDFSRVKIDQKDGKILVQFPYMKGKTIDSKPKEKRNPVGPSEGDVSI